MHWFCCPGIISYVWRVSHLILREIVADSTPISSVLQQVCSRPAALNRFEPQASCTPKFPSLRSLKVSQRVLHYTDSQLIIHVDNGDRKSRTTVQKKYWFSVFFVIYCSYNFSVAPKNHELAVFLSKARRRREIFGFLCVYTRIFFVLNTFFGGFFKTSNGNQENLD